MTVSTSQQHPNDQSRHEDVVYRNAKREAWVITGMFTVCLVYTCTYCYLFGYTSHEGLPGSTGQAIGEMVGPLEQFNRDPKTLTTPFGLGIPDWILYGIVIPWLACIAASFWFCIFYFAEDDLGSDDTSTDNANS